MSRFFIDRPIFAWVIALVIMLAGGLAILKLPINQYPSIAAPMARIHGFMAIPAAESFVIAAVVPFAAA